MPSLYRRLMSVVADATDTSDAPAAAAIAESAATVDNAAAATVETDAMRHCQVCREPYSDAQFPCVLDGCGHTYCRTCIETLLATASPVCPMCRAASSGSVPNWAAAQLLGLQWHARDTNTDTPRMPSAEHMLRESQRREGLLERGTRLGVRLMFAFMSERAYQYALRAGGLRLRSVPLEFTDAQLAHHYDTYADAQTRTLLERDHFVHNALVWLHAMYALHAKKTQHAPFDAMRIGADRYRAVWYEQNARDAQATYRVSDAAAQRAADSSIRAAPARVATAATDTSPVPSRFMPRMHSFTCCSSSDSSSSGSD